MRRIVVTVVLLAALLLGGCGGVYLNAEYSALLDTTAALSAETARRAEAGELAGEQMTTALREQANVWAAFQDARDGRAPGGGEGGK